MREQINALDLWCDHEHPRPRGVSVFRIPTVRQSKDEECNLQVWKTVYLIGSGFSKKRVSQCSRLRAISHV
jgi:hypothetical protein